MTGFSTDGVPIQASATADGAPLLPSYVSRKALNTIEVFDQDDFGIFVADEVTLIDDTIYRIMAPFVLSKGGLVIPDGATVEFQSTGQMINFITYTNANKPFLRGDSVTALKWTNLRVVFISATQELFDLTGNGMGPIQMNFGEFAGIANAGLGHITGFVTNLLSYSAFVGFPAWADELLIKDVDTLAFGCGFFNIGASSNNALLAFESTAEHCFEVVNSRMVLQAGESALRVSTLIQDDASRVVVESVITGTLGDLFDPSGLDEIDPRVNSKGNFGRADSTISIEGNLAGAADTTLIPVVNAWIRPTVDVSWVYEEANRLVGSTSGTVEYIGLEPATLKLDGSISLEPPTGTRLLAATFVRTLRNEIPITFDNTTNTFTAVGLSNGEIVDLEFTPGTLPTGLRTDALYYIVNDDQFSYTPGGAVVTFSDDGTGPNTVDHAELHGSEAHSSVAKGNPISIPLTALALFNPGDHFEIFVRNVENDADIEATIGYLRGSS